MKPYVTLLLNFMAEKAKLVAKFYPGVDFYNAGDAEDLSSWKEAEAREFFLNLKFGLRRYPKLNDCDLCPWCALRTCSAFQGKPRCGYQDRHGQCDDTDSAYDKIFQRGSVATRMTDAHPEEFLELAVKYLDKFSELEEESK